MGAVSGIGAAPAHARSPPEAVAEVVERALTGRHPRTRYLAGKNSVKLALLAKLLPEKLLDAAVLSSLGWARPRTELQGENMRIFVAGATGAIGRPLVSALVAARHEVVGMTCSADGLSTLQQLGAEGVVVNAFDSEAVNTLFRKLRPRIVIDELTSLPKDYTPESMRAAAERDRKVRLEGGRNVHEAARIAGAKRYIVQSTGFFYGPGPGLAAETDPLAINASPGVAGSVRTYLQVEERAFGSKDLEGVALRYGFFYGPGTYHDPENGSITQQVRKQQYPVVGSGAGVFSFVHIEDASSATVAALESDPGVYNVVDDDPSQMNVWLLAFARFVGAPPPSRISEEQAQLLGADVVYYATRLRGAQNGRAKRKLGFKPRRLEWLAKA